MLDPQKELDRLEAQLQSTGDVLAFLNELSRIARIRRLEVDDGGLESTLAQDGKDLPPIPTPPAPVGPLEDPERIDAEPYSVDVSLPQLTNEPPAGTVFSYDTEPLPLPEAPATPTQATGDFTGSAALPVGADDEEGGLPQPPLPIGQGDGGTLPQPPPPAQNPTVEASLPSDLGPLPAPSEIELPEQPSTPRQDSGVDLGVQASAVNALPAIETPGPPQPFAGYRDEEFFGEVFRVQPPETVPTPEAVVTQEQDNSILNQLADDDYTWREMVMDVMTKQQEELAIQMARMYRLHAQQQQQRSYYQ